MLTGTPWWHTPRDKKQTGSDGRGLPAARLQPREPSHILLFDSAVMLTGVEFLCPPSEHFSRQPLAASPSDMFSQVVGMRLNTIKRQRLSAAK
jgi:hypothetical protein